MSSECPGIQQTPVEAHRRKNAEETTEEPARGRRRAPSRPPSPRRPHPGALPEGLLRGLPEAWSLAPARRRREGWEEARPWPWRWHALGGSQAHFDDARGKATTAGEGTAHKTGAARGGGLRAARRKEGREGIIQRRAVGRSQGRSRGHVARKAARASSGGMVGGRAVPRSPSTATCGGTGPTWSRGARSGSGCLAAPPLGCWPTCAGRTAGRCGGRRYQGPSGPPR